MSLARSFPPLSDSMATTLILGSIPGQASLAAGQYYAHPRNAFWPIMGELFGAGPALEYARRAEILGQAQVAVWDVLGQCARPGSLDSAIEREGMIANDFRWFLAAHPRISRVFFNGAMAAQLFERLVAPVLQDPLPPRVRLPSTSPAHAGMTFAQKLGAWRAVAEKSSVAINRRSP